MIGFWKQRSTRFWLIFPVCAAVLFWQYLENSISLSKTGAESGWHELVASSILLWGCITIFLSVSEFLWKLFKLPQS